MEMKPNFKFKVLSEISLSEADVQSLTFLYQPIMGVDAFSLYFQLQHTPTGHVLAHHFLLQTTTSSMADFMLTRHRLEAIGLVDTFESGDLMVYQIKQPLSAKQFFSDAIMRAVLSIKVGLQEFNHLKLLLVRGEDLFEGVKITKRFDEIFDIRPLSRVNPSALAKTDKHIVHQGIEMTTFIDEAFIGRILVGKGISEEMITPELVRMLNELAFLYKFDAHELARLVFDAMTADGTVDEGKMKQLARIQFGLVSKGEHVALITNDETPQQELPEAGEKSDIINFLEQSPVDFLRFKSGGKTPVPADMKLVEWLFVDQGLPAGVINVLVDYVLDYTDGQMPKQLIEKIAGQWQRQGIHTTEAAMKKVANVLKKSTDHHIDKKQSQLARQANRREPIPEWLQKSQESQLFNGSNIDHADDIAAADRINQMKKAMLGTGGENNEKIE